MEMSQSKAYIQTFGCQMNEHDSFRMIEVLARQGYAMTQEVDDANLVILNTCSVRQNPENKVYSLLGRLRKLKRDRDVIIGVGGCVAQQEGEKILERERCVDMVFGPDNYFRLPEMIEQVRRGDSVVTSGGIIGKVTKVKDEGNEIEVEIADGVKVRIVRSSIAQILSKTEPAPAAKAG